MFSKLRNFSEDVAKSLNDIGNEDQKKVAVRELQNGNKVLHTQTPDPNDLVQPKDEPEETVPQNDSNSSKAENNGSELSSPPPTENLKLAPATQTKADTNVIQGIDLDTLTPQVRAKMKKFAKYEEKYPLLLDAYKTEKRKSELIGMFEKLLSENTPISSIADAGVLIDYLKGLNEKTTMLNTEMRRLSREKTNLSKAKSDLEGTVAEANKKNKAYEMKIAELESQNVSDKETKAGIEGTREVDELKNDLKVAEDNLAKYNETLSELKKSLENAEKQVSSLTEQTHQLETTNTEKDTQLSKIKQDILDCEKKISQLQDEKKKIEKENSELAAQLASSQSEKVVTPQADAKSNTQQTAGNRKKNKKGKKNNANNTNVPSPSNDTHTDSVIKEFENKIKELERELASAKLSLNNDVASSNNIASDFKELKEKYQLQSEDLEEVRDLLRDVGNELVQAKDTIKELKERAENDKELNVKLETLEQDLSLLKKEKAELEVKMAELESSERDNAEKDDKKAVEVSTEANEAYKKLEGDNGRLESALKSVQKELETTKADLERSRRETESVTQEKLDLNKRVSELSKHKSSDTSSKLELSSLQVSLDHKEKQVKSLQQEVESLAKKEKELSDSLALAKRQKMEFEANNKSLVHDKNELITKQELEFEKSKSLEQKLFNLQAEKQAFATELDNVNRKYDGLMKEKLQVSSELLVFKQRYEELFMKSKEVQDKVDGLQDEVSEARNMLLERTRESNTIRRLLMDAEDSLKAKDKDVAAEIQALKEEREHAEAEWLSSSKKKQREIDEMKSITDSYLTKLQELESRYTQLKTKYDEAVAGNPVNPAESIGEENEEALETIEILRTSLRDSTKKIKDYENMHNILKKLNEESNLKFERLLKSYKLLTQQYQSLKETLHQSKTESNGSTASSSRRASVDVHNEAATVGSNKHQTNIAYLKNVLLGFFEHKEQREQLLPVVKTLFDLSPEDERKFLVALK